jgi:photosystem II stability/assembly factor-like uncharacterized protein
MEEKQPLRQGKRRKPFFLLTLVLITPFLMGALCPTSTSSTLNKNGDSSGSSLSPFGPTDISQLKMFDANNGWALTSDGVMKTTDGGKNWTDVTPTDWGPADTSQSGTPVPTPTPNPASAGDVEEIGSALFFDMDHIWIVASTRVSQADIDAQSTAISNMMANNPTPDADLQSVDTSKLPNVGTNVYVRSTIDGGKTWMTSNPLPAENLGGLSEPNFLDIHEGWLELMVADNNSQKYMGVVYHTLDGGITWKTTPGNIFLPTLGKIYGDAEQLTGMTIVARQRCSADKNAPITFRPCPQQDTTSPQACTVTTMTAQQGWGTGTKTNSLFLQSSDDGVSWSQDTTALFVTPGGAPKQGNKSLIMSSPPTIFADGSGILPVQMQSDPEGDDPSHFFLHLFAVLVSPVTGLGYTLANLGPTSSFAVQPVAGNHALAASSAGHIFVVGQDYTNGEYGDWNLYEMVGGVWHKLGIQYDASIPAPQDGKQPDFMGAGLANLSFISDTEGWATAGSALYHITINGGNATWALVSTAARTLPKESEGSDQKPTLIKPAPGLLVAAPTNPPVCDSESKKNNNNNSPGVVDDKDPNARTITFVNNTSQTIWAGALGNAGIAAPENGGWEMAPGSTHTFKVANNWGGRFWGRTNCSFDASGKGTCETGDCGGVLQCNGAGGVPPASLAEFTFSGADGQDTYDVSYVDGFNVPMTVTPLGAGVQTSSDPYWCGVAGCGTDLNSSCPEPLRVMGSGGKVVGCKTACTAFNTDLYCCKGAHNTPATCQTSTWPVDYHAYFKAACPTAYSYAYDDPTSTFHAPLGANYRITFGPAGG